MIKNYDKKPKRLWIFFLPVIFILLGLVSCMSSPVKNGDADMEIRMSSMPLSAPSSLQSDGISQLVDANSSFALELLGNIFDREANLVFSPHSLSTVLAMPFAGARGQTETQMAGALHFTLSQEKLHQAFNALNQNLSGYQFAQLTVSNAVWGSPDTPYQEPFLDILAEFYGTGVRLVDFSDSRGAVQQINRWVSDQTLERIPELLAPDAIKNETDLVLTNAVYFKAAWAEPFSGDATRDGIFNLLDGGKVIVPMMSRLIQAKYSEDLWGTAIEIPYEGLELSMVILLPKSDSFDSLIADFNGTRLNQILEQTAPKSVRLTLPKFQLESKVQVKESLMKMGMVDPFGNADFSGIDGTHELFIDDIYHQAFINVAEAGTEAAAASAVVMSRKGIPQSDVELVVDHPFIFLIRDNTTGAILFLGYIVDPSI